MSIESVMPSSHLILCEVIDKVLLGSSGLNGQGLVGCIYDDAVRRKTLLPFVIAEIDLGGSKGWAVRPLKRHASWVQNVVRQFGPYPSQAKDT